MVNHRDTTVTTLANHYMVGQPLVENLYDQAFKSLHIREYDNLRDKFDYLERIIKQSLRWAKSALKVLDGKVVDLSKLEAIAPRQSTFDDPYNYAKDRDELAAQIGLPGLQNCSMPLIAVTALKHLMKES